MNRVDAHQPLSSHFIYFAKVDSISQSFVSHRPNLNIVSICLRNPSRLLTPLKFELLDSSSQVIRSINFAGGNIDSFDCTKFQFEPVTDSSGKSYIARIKTDLAQDLGPKEIESAKSGLYVESHPGGDYLGGNAYMDNVETMYDLHFKTMYRQELSAVFKESYQGFFIRLTKDPLFFLGFILILGLVIKKFRKAK
ncbi:MAG: hypothetical protein WAV40_05275 [Microgenomates group bacterium]